ncbi:MAG: MobC family plasmid mobilization relaxosome protein [Gammaproteobacteria bacterium]|nr:MobC family plasmid mobilization relaxosome protein [Gammaproteobacteria bacterium]
MSSSFNWGVTLKTSRINLRISDVDKNALKVKARAAGLTLSEFLVCAGLVRHISCPPARVDVEMLTHISRIGNNLNQLAHTANCGEPVSTAALTDIAEELKLLRTCIQ